MPKFIVKLRVLQHEFYEVDAESAEEAAEACAYQSPYTTDTEEFQVISVRERKGHE